MAGPIVPGNIDLLHRPRVLNPDGSISTVFSRSSNENGQEVLIPSVIPSAQGGYYTDTSPEGKASWDYYRRTGQHLGKFATPAEADAYAEQLHQNYAAGKLDASGKPTLSVNGSPIEMAVSHRPAMDRNAQIRQALMTLLMKGHGNGTR